MRNKKLQGQALFDFENKPLKDDRKMKENRKRSPLKKISPKGRRKLSFQTKKPGLLNGKKFFLDIQGFSKIDAIKQTILQLGGTVEEFNSKDVYCIITNRVSLEEIISYRSHNRNGIPSPLPCLVPSPQNVQTPSPSQHISSIKGKVDSPLSTDSLQTQQSLDPRSINVTRGKSLLNKAVSSTQKQGSSNLLQLAQKWGTKVLHIDHFMKWTKEKEVAKFLHVRSEKDNAKISTSTHHSKGSFKVKKLKSPFIKVEGQTRKYRPFFSELDEWPVMYFESSVGSCPFEKPEGRRAAAEDDDQMSDKETNKDDSSQKLSNGTPEQKMPEIKPSHKDGQGDVKVGYCECCFARFSNLSQHLKSGQHQSFARNDANYADLDSLMKRAKAFDDFLKEIQQKHEGSTSNTKEEKLISDTSVIKIESKNKAIVKESSIKPGDCHNEKASTCLPTTTGFELSNLKFSGKENQDLQSNEGQRRGSEQATFNTNMRSTTAVEDLDKENQPFATERGFSQKGNNITHDHEVVHDVSSHANVKPATNRHTKDAQGLCRENAFTAWEAFEGIVNKSCSQGHANNDSGLLDSEVTTLCPEMINATDDTKECKECKENSVAFKPSGFEDCEMVHGTKEKPPVESVIATQDKKMHVQRFDNVETDVIGNLCVNSSSLDEREQNITSNARVSVSESRLDQQRSLEDQERSLDYTNKQEKDVVVKENEGRLDEKERRFQIGSKLDNEISKAKDREPCGSSSDEIPVDPSNQPEAFSGSSTAEMNDVEYSFLNNAKETFTKDTVFERNLAVTYQENEARGKDFVAEHIACIQSESPIERNENYIAKDCRTSTKEVNFLTNVSFKDKQSLGPNSIYDASLPYVATIATKQQLNDSEEKFVLRKTSGNDSTISVVNATVTLNKSCNEHTETRHQNFNDNVSIELSDSVLPSASNRASVAESQYLLSPVANCKSHSVSGGPPVEKNCKFSPLSSDTELGNKISDIISVLSLSTEQNRKRQTFENGKEGKVNCKKALNLSSVNESCDIQCLETESNLKEVSDVVWHSSSDDIDQRYSSIFDEKGYNGEVYKADKKQDRDVIALAMEDGFKDVKNCKDDERGIVRKNHQQGCILSTKKQTAQISDGNHLLPGPKDNCGQKRSFTGDVAIVQEKKPYLESPATPFVEKDSIMSKLSVKQLLGNDFKRTNSSLADDVYSFLDQDFKKGISMHERLKARRTAASATNSSSTSPSSSFQSPRMDTKNARLQPGPSIGRSGRKRSIRRSDSVETSGRKTLKYESFASTPSAKTKHRRGRKLSSPPPQNEYYDHNYAQTSFDFDNDQIFSSLIRRNSKLENLPVQQVHVSRSTSLSSLTNTFTNASCERCHGRNFNPKETPYHDMSLRSVNTDAVKAPAQGTEFDSPRNLRSGKVYREKRSSMRILSLNHSDKKFRYSETEDELT